LSNELVIDEPQYDNSFLGNPNLKPVGFKISYTYEQVKEILNCSNDPIYFIEHYCYIVSLDKGLVLFNLYECQKEKIKTIMENRKIIEISSRQSGKTITTAACILWYSLFQSSKTVAILANKANSAREVLHRYQIMYENLPIWMQQGVKIWNKGDVELENGSIVFTAATSASAIRGRSCNWLYVDEAALIPNNMADEFFTSVYPTISSGETTKILLTSTPMGYNHFWKFWNEAQNNRNGFVPIFIPYNRIPGRDQKWADEQKALLGELKFNQEIACQFLGSSNTLIPPEVIGRMSPLPFTYSKDGLDILEDPIRTVKNIDDKIITMPHLYFLVADTSRGVGGDFSAFTVMDITEYPYKVVAKYRDNKINPLLYPTVIAKVANDYNKAFVLVEINDIGQQIANTLYMDLEYENVLAVSYDGKTGQFLSAGFKTGTSLGVRTTKQVKRLGCQLLKGLIENKKFLINDSDIISELSTFIEQRGSYAADLGYHDDLVMTIVLFAWASNELYFKELTNTNLRIDLYKNQIQDIEDDLTPFGFIDDGIDDMKPEVDNMSGDIWFHKDLQAEMEKLKDKWYQKA
jgi:hypothetical protein